jgi:hypothetical protein
MLTEAQAKSVCDYINARQGGYNKPVSCGGGVTQMSHTNQATCLGDLAAWRDGCPTLTVGDVEGCANGPGGNLCTLVTAPECKNVLACLDSLPQQLAQGSNVRAPSGWTARR